LHHACKSGRNPTAVSLLLNRGANPNARQITKRTPLHGVCMRGLSQAGQIFLDRGAAVYAVTNEGMTPLPAQSARTRVVVAAPTSFVNFWAIRLKFADFLFFIYPSLFLLFH
jgi:hypothetical protein